jgi:hypothetical protein
VYLYAARISIEEKQFATLVWNRKKHIIFSHLAPAGNIKPGTNQESSNVLGQKRRNQTSEEAINLLGTCRS